MSGTSLLRCVWNCLRRLTPWQWALLIFFGAIAGIITALLNSFSAGTLTGGSDEFWQVENSCRVVMSGARAGVAA